MKNKRLTPVATKKLIAARSLIYYYRKYRTKRGKTIIEDLKKRIEKIKADHSSYEAIEIKRKNYQIRSIRAQIWNIKRYHPHREDKKARLQTQLQKLLQTG